MALRWGLVGTNRDYAQGFIAPAIQAAEGCELRAICGRDPERTREAAANLGLECCYVGLEPLLADPEINAVYLCTPHHVHAEQTILVAEAGKHVLCEKPIDINVESARRAIDACAAHGVSFAVQHPFRFEWRIIKARELIEAGMLGQLISARCRVCLWEPSRPEGWVKSKKLAGGGPVMGVGIQCVDILRVLLGEVREVAAFMDNLTFDFEVEDTGSILLRFESGAHGMIQNTANLDWFRNTDWEVHGTKASLRSGWCWGRNRTPWLHLQEDDKTTEFAPFGKDLFQAHFEHFAACVAEGKPPLTRGEEGLENLRVILAAYESSETRNVVVLR